MNEIIKLYLESGLSVIPIVPGEKRPAIDSWMEYQKRIASYEEAKRWNPPIALICGQVSNGLVCIDFDDGGSKFHEWLNLISTNAPEILPKFCIQKTPSGGYHVFYRVAGETFGNLKLAQKANKDVLIETRGDGGYFLVDPSQNYKIIEGSISDLQHIPFSQHDFLLACARSFNEKIEPVYKPKVKEYDITENTPFNDYDRREDGLTLLMNAGWTIAFRRGDAVYLKRPGKKEKGVSATWNHIPNHFYCFSTNSQFENEKAYLPSMIYTMLEHGGNYSAAAKELYRLGYGDRAEARKERQAEQPAKEQPAKEEAVETKMKIVTINELSQKIDNFYIKGSPRGYSTGFENLDNYYRVARGQLNIVTGLPTHGKSELMDAVMVNMAVLHGWRFLVFSPENYPYEMHYQKLAEKYIGKPFFGPERFTVQDNANAKSFLSQHFYFIDYFRDSITLDEILNVTQTMAGKIDGLIIDPWNELEGEIGKEKSETQWIGECLSKIRKKARAMNVAIWVVAHPTKIQKDKDGNYPIPTMYSISGSANWYNKADNGLVVYRNFEENYTEVHVQKVKFKYYGSHGSARFSYLPMSGRYEEMDVTTTKRSWLND
jgi:hypothetical protein